MKETLKRLPIENANVVWLRSAWGSGNYTNSIFLGIYLRSDRHSVFHQLQLFHATRVCHVSWELERSGRVIVTAEGYDTRMSLQNRGLTQWAPQSEMAGTRQML